MSQPFQVVCPTCRQHLRVSGAAAGRQVRCPHCHAVVLVPDQSQPTTGSAGLWLVRTENGKTYGPVSRAELAQWVDEGRVHAGCHLSPDGAQQWIWASEMFPQLVPAVEVNSAAMRPPAYYISGPVSDKSRTVAGLLGLLLPLLGLNGIHRLYTGHIAQGILMLITCGGCLLWQLVDVILVFAGAVRDADGLPLRD